MGLAVQPVDHRDARSLECIHSAQSVADRGERKANPVRSSSRQATFASKLVIDGESAQVTREVDTGLETIEVDLPAVVTVDLRLNEPRFVKLPDIMKAKRKPLDVVPLDELGVDTASNVEVTGFSPPPQRGKGIMVEDAAQLVQELRNRGLL